METFTYIFASTLVISLISLIGVITLAMSDKLLGKILLLLVSFSAGALMGGAFLHLIPEAVENFQGSNIYSYILIGFISFFLVEKILHWRHCHDGDCKVHSFAYMNLFGDSVHNFLDGLAIAASFVTSIPLGVTTTIAVALHEIPQEIGDFGVLVYGGFKKLTALSLNFITAMTSIAGGVVGFLLAGYPEFASLLIPFTAGGFIYIAASDLIPEIRKETSLVRGGASFLFFIFGILIMLGLKILD